MRLTALGKIVLLILVAGIAIGVWNFWAHGGAGMMSKLAPEAKTKESAVPTRANLPDAAPSTGVQPVSTTAFSMPGAEPGCADKPEVRWLLWAWNSQMGAMLANGGPQATKDSLMCQHGVNLKMIRQDDVERMQAELVTFAQELKNGNPQPKKGAHFVAIMGDGSATFLKSVNDQLKRLGPEYTARVIGSCGYSRGEDKFMGPAAWKANPETARGGVVAGYLRDGDWNIAQKWLGDNGLKNNPDEKTYDPDALNWVSASDYIDAGQKYIAGYTETRPVVRNGKRTGETKKITVQGVVTWTPGDVTVAKEKGGLVSVASTKEYSSQMPNTIIGINKWMQANRPTVQGMLQAIMEGGDLVRSNPDALHYAAGISAKVYGEQDASYWEKYYRGVTEPDKTGQTVELGGSTVNNLADNLLLFGMVEGGANLFEATYTVFGDIVKNQYPELVPSYPPVGSILDTSYLAGIRKQVAPAQLKTAVASVKPQASQGKSGEVVSRRAWKIPFQSGKADFSPAAARQLQQLRRDLLVAGGTTIEVHGHTDSQGNPQTNMGLSEARAFAVKKWLEKQSPVNFPSGRVRVFAHGQTNPVAPNSSEAGRAQNRRVEIVLTASK